MFGGSYFSFDDDDNKVQCSYNHQKGNESTETEIPLTVLLCLFNSLKLSNALYALKNSGNISSDNGLSPGWRLAINRTNAGLLSIGNLGTNFSEIVIEIQTFSLKKIYYLKISSGKWRPFCLVLNVLRGLDC